MKHKLLRMLFCAGLLAGLLTVTALAADWTYDPTHQRPTSGSGPDAVTLNNVTANGTALTIGENPGFHGAALIAGAALGAAARKEDAKCENE